MADLVEILKQHDQLDDRCELDICLTKDGITIVGWSRGTQIVQSATTLDVTQKVEQMMEGLKRDSD